MIRRISLFIVAGLLVVLVAALLALLLDNGFLTDSTEPEEPAEPEPETTSI